MLPAPRRRTIRYRAGFADARMRLAEMTQRRSVGWLPWLLGAAGVAAVVFVALHAAEERAIVNLFQDARPTWLILALATASRNLRGAGRRLARRAATRRRVRALHAGVPPEPGQAVHRPGRANHGREWRRARRERPGQAGGGTQHGHVDRRGGRRLVLHRLRHQSGHRPGAADVGRPRESADRHGRRAVPLLRQRADHGGPVADSSAAWTSRRRACRNCPSSAGSSNCCNRATRASSTIRRCWPAPRHCRC